MTRINDVADLLGKSNCGCVPGETAACELDAAGHLMPDLPEPCKSIDGSRHWGHGVSWCPEHGLCRWEDGVGGSTTAEALRQEAAELLAAASYAERNKE